MPTSFFSPQDKLTKSLTYILGNQDTVQTQICELEETVRHTEVREGTEVGPGPCLAVGAGRGWRLVQPNHLAANSGSLCGVHGCVKALVKLGCQKWQRPRPGGTQGHSGDRVSITRERESLKSPRDGAQMPSGSAACWGWHTSLDQGG